MTTRKPIICFLGQLGAPGRYDPAIFQNQPGGDDEIFWFERMLDGLGILDRIDYRGHRICHGEGLPNLDDGDAFIIGGSFHSVHDELPWQRNLRAWLAAQRDRARPAPVFGICGGHQIISQTLGGTVEMLPDGPTIGTLPVSLTEAGRESAIFGDIVPRFNFGNEEHVSRAPEGAVVLATTATMPHCALDYGRGWVSVQFHPEATDRCMAESWGPKAATIADHYTPTPEAPGLFANFLKTNGLL